MTLTRRGHEALRRVPVAAVVGGKARRVLLGASRAESARKAKAGPEAERSQDIRCGDDRARTDLRRAV